MIVENNQPCIYFDFCFGSELILRLAGILGHSDRGVTGLVLVLQHSYES